MSNILHIAALQAHLAWENPAENRAYFDQKISELNQELDLIVLPEMFATGFSMSPQGRADQGEMLSWMKAKTLPTGAALEGQACMPANAGFPSQFLHSKRRRAGFSLQSLTL